MRILLHTCCAPCATYPIRRLASNSHDVIVYFHNPNIHPATEFASRLGSVLRLTDKWGIQCIADSEYGLARFMRRVSGVEFEPERCARCYAMRLDAAAEKAAAGGFDAFTTTLLISPYQNHDAIVRAGERAAEEHGVAFHYEDFREGFSQARILAREEGLYCQKYCGCVFSEAERYADQMDKLIRRARDG